MLHQIVQNFVDIKCPLLLTDKWGPYQSLKRLGYNHRMVNHSQNYVDPEN